MRLAFQRVKATTRRGCRTAWLIFMSLSCFLVGCWGTPTMATELGTMKADYKRPDTIPFPANNPYTPEKAILGKMLFFDPRLSGAENMNCASCHNPSFGWEVPVSKSIGAQNTALGRHNPTILNMAWVSPNFWDGRAANIEEQAKGPIQSQVEMNLPMDKLIEKLKRVTDYQTIFNRVFPGQGITEDTVVKAIATFERITTSSYAPFDAWVDGDETAISDAAKQGFALFNGKAQCAGCHSGWNFTDNKFHDIGLPTADIGRGKYEPDNPLAQYAFKTPGLRDIGQRAPYMHDGSLPDLNSVMGHYISGGSVRPSRSPLMQAIALNPAEVDDIKAFLLTLTGTKSLVPLPVLPN